MFLADSVLCIGGKAPELLPPALDSLPLIAADGGLKHILRWNLHPSAVIGDMDSLSPDDLKSVPTDILHRHPREKNNSDAELGLNFAQREYGPAVAMLGGGGGRMDHLLALLQLFVRDHPPGCWLTDCSWMEVLSEKTVITGGKTLTVSFFVLGGEYAELTSRGLQWPFSMLTPQFGSLSNVIVDHQCCIEIHRGKVMMVLPFPCAVEVQRINPVSAVGPYLR